MGIQSERVRSEKRKRIWLIALVAVLGVLLVLAFYPYVWANDLTTKYGQQFSEGYLEPGYFNECDYFKVVKYKGKGPYVYCSGRGIRDQLRAVSENESAVLYVVNDHSDVILIVFEESGEDSWTMKEWSCVWSSSGSADEFTWPLYR